MYDQAKAIGEAWVAAAYPTDLVETTKADLENMYAELDRL
jgi:hypothetical protein